MINCVITNWWLVQIDVKEVDDPSIRICFPSKAEFVSVNAFNMITGTKASKILVKYISYNFKCKFYCRKCNSKQKYSNDKS